MQYELLYFGFIPPPTVATTITNYSRSKQNPFFCHDCILPYGGEWLSLRLRDKSLRFRISLWFLMATCFQKKWPLTFVVKQWSHEIFHQPKQDTRKRRKKSWKLHQKDMLPSNLMNPKMAGSNLTPPNNGCFKAWFHKCWVKHTPWWSFLDPRLRSTAFLLVQPLSPPTVRSRSCSETTEAWCQPTETWKFFLQNRADDLFSKWCFITGVICIEIYVTCIYVCVICISIKKYSYDMYLDLYIHIYMYIYACVCALV